MEIRSLREDELEQAWELDRYAFNTPARRRELFLRWDPSRLVGAFESGRLVALTGGLDFGQFFGGRSVPMGGLSSVSVAPDRRGRGLAKRVIREVLRAMRERGEVISSLYPATTSLYRGLGWEVAGTTLVRRVAPATLQALPAPDAGLLRPAGVDEIDALRACYGQLARGVNGFVDRSENWWGRLAHAWKDRRVYVAEGDPGEVEGYLVYRQLDGEHSAFGGPWVLGVDEIDALRACYGQLARSVNGFVDRSENWWGRLAHAWKDRRVYVAEGDQGEVEGYLVYRQIDGEHSAFGGAWVLGVDDVVANTRDAALALWRLLGSWASQAQQIIYRGTAEDPLLLLLPEQSLEVVAEVRWMTRMVDAVGAVDARGFSPGVEVEVHVALRDPELSDNDGRFVLTVSEGRGRLEPGGSGAVTLDVGPFSALYTGWASTSLLARAGRIAGGTREDRAALDAAFGGPVPWMLDEF